jgi:chromate transporter
VTVGGAGDVDHLTSLGTVAGEWGRIGCLGFGGPPSHIVMLRELCVDRRKWMTSADFEDAVVACSLLPGPASTQLAIYCASRVRGRVGALIGGLAFIVPGLAMVLALATLFLESSPPAWIAGAGAGAGAAVAAASIGAYLVLMLIVCGATEVALHARRHHGNVMSLLLVPIVRNGIAAGTGGSVAVAWTALKVGALAYGGGFVIIPLMRSDAVDHYNWMTGTQFLNAVALGQVTPGPVTQTVAAVGYAAAGAILGSAVALARAITEPWQVAILLGAAVLLLAFRRGGGAHTRRRGCSRCSHCGLRWGAPNPLMWSGKA